MKIEIGLKEYELPESWNEITLGTFMKWYVLTKKETAVGLDYSVELLALLLNAPTSEIEEIYVDDIKDLMNELLYLNTMPVEGAQKEKFTLLNEAGESVIYVAKNSTKLKVKEQLTIEHLLKDQTDNTLIFPEILAILLRPAIESYNAETGLVQYKQSELDEDMESIIKRANIFREQLTIGEVWSNIVFFSNIVKELSTETTVHSSSVRIVKRSLSS
jgi:hypothetical protein